MTFWLIILFIASSLIQIYFWWIQMGQLSRHPMKATTQSTTFPKVAVLIAAKNEAKQIKEHLPTWINQDYPSFSIYILNDHSTDDTAQLSGQNDFNNVCVLNLPKGITGKKKALTYGIDLITAEWIVTMDADCYPNSPNWLSTILRKHASSDVILGYSPYLNLSGSLLSRMIQYESWFVAAQYMSAAIMGRPYMGVGRNLAFRKSLFHEVGGYKDHISVPGGDDDLFISSLPETVRFAIETAPEAWVWTYPKNSIIDYWQQKRRHLSTAPLYKTRTKIWLAFIYISQLCWYVSLFILSFSYPWMLFLLLVRGLFLLKVTYRPKDIDSLSPNFKLSLIYDFILCMFYTGLSLTYLYPKRDW